MKDSDELSTYVTYGEMVRSATATKHKIKNVPGKKEIENAIALCEKVYDPLRAWYGKGIPITSFFRSAAVNSINGGSSTSQHVTGQAMDIDTVSDNKKLFEYIKDHLDYDQLIYEFGDDTNPGWVHVSYSLVKNRRQVLRAYRHNGKVVYVPMK